LAALAPWPPGTAVASLFGRATRIRAYARVATRAARAPIGPGSPIPSIAGGDARPIQCHGASVHKQPDTGSPALSGVSALSTAAAGTASTAATPEVSVRHLVCLSAATGTASTAATIFTVFTRLCDTDLPDPLANPPFWCQFGILPILSFRSFLPLLAFLTFYDSTPGGAGGRILTVLGAADTCIDQQTSSPLSPVCHGATGVAPTPAPFAAGTRRTILPVTSVRPVFA
jgi:hypothetical protein